MIGTLDTAPPALDTAEAEALLRDYYDIHCEAKLLVSERDQNFRINVAGQPSYLLKIANAAESPEAIEYENAALEHLHAVSPGFPCPKIVKSADGSNVILLHAENETTYLVRLMTWLDGTMLREVSATTALRRELGARLAELGRGLRGFFHAAAAKPILWDITRVAELRDIVSFVDDEPIREFCTTFIRRFEDEIAPALMPLRSQVIHNDLNPSNVLVTNDGAPGVSGIVDFGDMVHAPLICDVAVGAAYQLAEDNDPLATAVEFVAAYHRVTPFEPAELDILFDLIVARMVATIVITSWRAREYPENKDYILRNAHSAIRNISRLATMDREKVADRFRRACPAIPATSAPGPSGESSDTLVSRRQNLLGSAYRLFYERPVHIVRGEDVWLYDADGKAYLDAYNNVPMVGHCHPHVVAALAAQASTLNSHTRYLHERVLQYAERLLAMFPEGLNRVMFGCTGSEANELAVRIARAYTGNQGVIATRFAYHGNTSVIAQLSPSYMAAEKRDDWAQVVAPPDTYRNGNGGDPDAVRAEFLAEIDAAIERMARHGIKPAALILDAGFTSDGMFQPPVGTLAEAARRVRAAGGIYIADEVQSGFARFGRTLWGFERDNVVPEIVTLGKPIGNGHPLAATIVRDDVLDAFSASTRYFNTFGGNPVSAAVGLAVLDVFERETLAANSVATGEDLHDQLRVLADQHPVIGDVRGSGLFAGVELVKDRKTKEPATDLTGQVVNSMREQGVLISMIGPESNVLKIRPPLPFQRHHVDQLVQTLDLCLSERG